MWTEPAAAEKLEEILRRACAGEPQLIEGEPPCVIISLSEYGRLKLRADAASSSSGFSGSIDKS